MGKLVPLQGADGIVEGGKRRLFPPFLFNWPGYLGFDLTQLSFNAVRLGDS